MDHLNVYSVRFHVDSRSNNSFSQILAMKTHQLGGNGIPRGSFQVKVLPSHLSPDSYTGYVTAIVPHGKRWSHGCQWCNDTACCEIWPGTPSSKFLHSSQAASFPLNFLSISTIWPVQIAILWRFSNHPMIVPWELSQNLKPHEKISHKDHINATEISHKHRIKSHM